MQLLFSCCWAASPAASIASCPGQAWVLADVTKFNSFQQTIREELDPRDRILVCWSKMPDLGFKDHMKAPKHKRFWSNAAWQKRQPFAASSRSKQIKPCPSAQDSAQATIARCCISHGCCTHLETHCLWQAEDSWVPLHDTGHGHWLLQGHIPWELLPPICWGDGFSVDAVESYVEAAKFPSDIGKLSSKYGEFKV